MPLSHDTILLETVRTRRVRLQSALLHGGMTARRPVHDNVRRVLGSFVAAAVACVGCVGFALVTGLIADRDAGSSRPAVPTRPAVTSPTDPRPAPTGVRP